MASASGTVFVWSKTSVYPPALSHSWERGRLWRIYPRRLAGNSTAGPGRQSRASRRKRRTFRPLTARSRLRCKISGDGGYITTEPIPGAGRSPLDKVSRSGARLLLQVLFPVRLRQFGRLFLFPLVQQRHDLLFHFGRSDLLAEILRQFSSRNNHTAILLFFFT